MYSEIKYIGAFFHYSSIYFKFEYKFTMGFGNMVVYVENMFLIIDGQKTYYTTPRASNSVPLSSNYLNLVIF